MEDEINISKKIEEPEEIKKKIINQIRLNIEENKNNIICNLITKWLKNQGYSPKLLTSKEINQFKADNREVLVAITEYYQAELESLKKIK